jgi:hypothetical protein
MHHKFSDFSTTISYNNNNNNNNNNKLSIGKGGLR